MSASESPGWLLLIHQLPAQPAYLRVRIGRELQRIGALPLKGAVHVLPATEGCRANLRALRGQIVEAGGGAVMVEATDFEGLGEPELSARFRARSEDDYRAIESELSRLLGELPPRPDAPSALRRRVQRRSRKAERELARSATTDFFGVGARASAEAALHQLEGWMERRTGPPLQPGTRSLDDYRGRTWTTRAVIFVDRMACAWLILRLLDPEARITYLEPGGARPDPEAVTFDMAGAEFGHRGELCSFEVLVQDFGIDDPAVKALGEIVHDLDLEDERYGRPEASGLGVVLSGIAARETTDPARLEGALAVFDDLYEHLTNDPQGGSLAARSPGKGRRS